MGLRLTFGRKCAMISTALFWGVIIHLSLNLYVDPQNVIAEVKYG